MLSICADMRASRKPFWRLLPDLLQPLVGVLLLGYWWTRGDPYAAGTRNDMDSVFGVVMYACILGLTLLALCMTGALVWLVLSWERRTMAARVTAGLCLLSLPVVFFVMVLSRPAAPAYLQGFVVWARQNANYQTLDSHRVALVQVAAAQPQQQGVSASVPAHLWPHAISALQPSYVVVHPDESVDFVWGGGFGHWGLYLHGHGPAQNPRVPGRLVLPVEPGLDAWSE